VIIINVNSWVTIAQANTYFLTRYGAGAWASLLDIDKEALLITAYNRIKNSNSVTIGAVTVKIKIGQMEYAWYIYGNNAEIEKHQALANQGIKQFNIGNFSETIENPNFIPDFILKNYYSDVIISAANKFFIMDRELE